MKAYLLDSHVLVWWLADQLDAEVTEAINHPDHVVWVSAVTPWELAIKRAAGRLDSPDDVLEAIDEEGFRSLEITGAHGERAATLPAHHRDPFDRMLVAQAQAEDLTLVSRDRAFEQYEVDLLRC